jgi:hypothetical protein
MLRSGCGPIALRSCFPGAGLKHGTTVSQPPVLRNEETLQVRARECVYILSYIYENKGVFLDGKRSWKRFPVSQQKIVQG